MGTTQTNMATPIQHVTLPLAADVALRLNQAASQTGLTLETFLLQLAEKTAQESNTPTEYPNKPLWERSGEEWRRALNAWCDSHAPTTHFVDDSRESIYAGRGE